MILDQIKKNLEKQIFAVFGLPKNFEIKWQTPPNPAWGDLALPIFEIAKTPKVQGDEIVKKVQKLKLPASVEKIETKAGYVNFFLEPNFLARGLAKELAAKSLGKKNSGKKKTIMLEFSQPNTHKEFHVGHLRGSVLGQSLVNILQAHGDKVIAANYLGDVGAHVAKWLWCYKKWHDGEEPGADKAKFLSKIYQEAAKKSEANPEHKKEVAQIQKKLEQGDRTLLRVWKKTRKWSIDEFKKIYKILGVNFDIYFYESEEEAPGKKIVEKLRRRGIAKTSRGAAVMDLEKYNLEIFLLQKADGAALYATKDLALAFKKFKKYKIDESWHLVDVRQTLYFRQLFKTLRLAGLKKIFKHLAYEFVSLPEGVISSRSGRMVGFNEIFEKVSGLAAQETAKRHKGWPKKKIERASRA
ncbi:arginine--tRNA ligase, partial [Patescibacteria group bacterium]|nr:arginine--tRNA ligase [Patescibacteria group bacterium]